MEIEKLREIDLECVVTSASRAEGAFGPKAT